MILGWRHIIHRCAIVCLAGLALLPTVEIARAEPVTEAAQVDPAVEAILSQMSPGDRVGQLFLVTYYGPDSGPDSDIARLIQRYRVGGVVLSIANDNFTDLNSLPTQVYDLASQMQTFAADRSPVASPTSTPQPASIPAPYVPLFVGLDYEDNGSRGYLVGGLTNLPDSMALGATWDPTLAESAGQVTGDVLAGLGINLLLGPSADVVEVPQPFTSGDLETRVFGGEPFWVSQMAASYVHGVHSGSNGRLAVVPRHFPGHGAADRLASVEVPTIRRSLEQLTQFDLIPFFAVTGDAPDTLSIADGLLTGHISYRGFQGDNQRVQTRPISLDQQALQALAKLDAIARWRSAGGLFVTDVLGLKGVRLVYDPQETSFPNRRIAQDALLAGNDVLYVGQFGSDPRSNQTATIADTIEYFVQSYTKDPAFQTRVDDAVRRILKKKLAIFGDFDLQRTVLQPESGIQRAGGQPEVTYKVAQSAVTLLSPSKPDLLVSPQSGDRIVVFTDTRDVRLCSTCEARPIIPVNALQSAITRLYGPQGSGVGLSSIQSYSFSQLADYLQIGPQFTTGDNATPVPDNLTIALNSADWVIFVMQDIDPLVPSSDIVKRFLAVPRISPHTQVVAIAMGAPYYLDSTEIGKLSAYYALYDSSAPFIDVAARAVFVGVPFSGASPVSVSGASYNILEATAPLPVQIIKLKVDSEPPQPQAAGTGTAIPVLKVKKGDTIRVSTGVIIDRNGHPVPDGTPVDFFLNYTAQGLRDTSTVTTSGGTAHTSLLLRQPGELLITAQSNPARQSDVVQIVIPDSGEGPVTVVPPNVTPTPTQSPRPVPTSLAQLPSDQPPNPDLKRVSFRDLMIAMFGLTLLGVGLFLVGRARRDLNYGLLLSLPPTISGLVGYNYYALLLPGTQMWRVLMTDFWAAGTAAWLAAIIGLGATLLLIAVYDRWLGAVPLGLGRQRRQH